ncbi:MAG: ribose-5-phosphate isomerase RpiA [Pseudomonadota bacterium]
MDKFKKDAAIAALSLVQDGMTIGLGTGSTAAHFVKALGHRGLKDIKGVPTSVATRDLAQDVGIKIIEPDETTKIDLAVDGTDEVDGSLNLIKGGGGALLREKIVAHAARRFIVIADGTKKVSQLGKFKLPLEIETALFGLTINGVRDVISSLGYQDVQIELRPGERGPFITDGGGYILDCALERITDAHALNDAFRSLPGVVETGLFIGLADGVILCGEDGLETMGTVGLD